MNKIDEFNAADALIGLATTNSNLRAMKKAHDDVGLTFDNGGKCVKFPVKLMEIVDCELLDNIVSWAPDGLSFTIHKPTMLEEKVLPLFFDTTSQHNTKYKSFLRKLYRWGFLKKYHQSNEFTYFHKYFQRGNLDLCLRITRESNSKNLKSMKASTGNNNNDFVRSQKDVPMQYDSNSLARITPTPPTTTSMTPNSADLLKHLEEQLILKKLKAAIARNASSTLESSISRSPPLSSNCVNHIISALSVGPTLTSSRMPIHNTHSDIDDADDIILRELKKNMILNQLLSATTAPESTTSSRYPYSVSRACSMSGVNELSFLSSNPPSRSSHPSINNNVSIAVAECLLRNSCHNQMINTDALLTPNHDNFNLMSSFTKNATEAAVAATTRRSTFPLRNPEFSPSSSSQLRLKLNGLDNNKIKNVFQYNHEQQTRQRKTHTHLMSAWMFFASP